jgi:hypothetical protein
MSSELDRFFAVLETGESEAIQLGIVRDASASPTIGQSLKRGSAQPRGFVCWHCQGTGKCGCITCGHLEAHAVWKAGSCVPCDVRRREQVQ